MMKPPHDTQLTPGKGVRTPEQGRPVQPAPPGAKPVREPSRPPKGANPARIIAYHAAQACSVHCPGDLKKYGDLLAVQSANLRGAADLLAEESAITLRRAADIAANREPAEVAQ